MQYTALSQILERARQGKKCTIAVAAPDDLAVLKALKQAVHENFVVPVFFGNRQATVAVANEAGFDIAPFGFYDEPDTGKACYMAAGFANTGEADIIMKGLVNTATFLKSVLNKDFNLLESKLLSHLSIIESPYYHKLLSITDVAINISPSLDEKIHIICNAVSVLHKLGNRLPRVALIAAIETVNSRIAATTDAALITIMNQRGQITGCTIEGPLALDNAISSQAASHKSIGGQVAGNADLLVVPDLNCGNILYKSLNFLGGATSAAIVTGARVPLVLTSRADSEQSKLMSIALATTVNSPV